MAEPTPPSAASALKLARPQSQIELDVPAPTPTIGASDHVHVGSTDGLVGTHSPPPSESDEQPNVVTAPRIDIELPKPHHHVPHHPDHLPVGPGTVDPPHHVPALHAPHHSQKIHELFEHGPAPGPIPHPLQHTNMDAHQSPPHGHTTIHNPHNGPSHPLHASIIAPTAKPSPPLPPTVGRGLASEQGKKTPLRVDVQIRKKRIAIAVHPSASLQDISKLCQLKANRILGPAAPTIESLRLGDYDLLPNDLVFDYYHPGDCFVAVCGPMGPNADEFHRKCGRTPLHFGPEGPPQIGQLVEIGRKPVRESMGKRKGGGQMQKHCVICKERNKLVYTTRMCPVNKYPICLPLSKASQALPIKRSCLEIYVEKVKSGEKVQRRRPRPSRSE